jgi:hypothetical protein
MKRTTLSVAAALSALCLLPSCNKSAAGGPEEGLLSGPTGVIRIEVGIPRTKSDDAALKDYQINTVQVIVFDDGGKKETDRYEALASPVQNTTSMTITTKTGAKTVYAIVNSPRLTESTLDKMEAHLSDLKENSCTGLVMSGKNAITVTEYDKNKDPNAAAQTMGIHVKRLASMIQLDKVTVDFRNTSLEGGTFTIQEIYLKNVVGRAPLGVTGSPATDMPMVLPDAAHTNYDYWYNKGTRQASGAPEVTFDVWTKSCSVAGAATTLSRDLFAYPNKTAGDSTADTFSQRKTRLVIKAHVTASTNTSPAVDKDTYYTFDLPVLVANNIYKIANINITMLGKDDDNSDEKALVGRVTPTITVDPWTGTTTLNYEM